MPLRSRFPQLFSYGPGAQGGNGRGQRDHANEEQVHALDGDLSVGVRGNNKGGKDLGFRVVYHIVSFRF